MDKLAFLYATTFSKELLKALYSIKNESQHVTLQIIHPFLATSNSVTLQLL